MLWGRVSDEKLARACLALAMAVAGSSILWLGRGTTFSLDELTWLLQSPHFGLAEALRPHEGHLVLVTRLVYWGVLEISGSGYLAFRLLAVATVLATVALLFVYASRRVPPLVALAPCLVLLFFGSDTLHVLVGNAFAVLFAVCMGIGALLALECEDGRGRALACALLCVGVATYSVALAFLAAAAVYLLLRKGGWRQLWVVAIPAVLYLGWFAWSRAHFDAAAGDAGGIGWENLLLVPAWSYQGLSAVLGALSGLEYGFGDQPPVVRAGPVLAALAAIGLGWRLREGSIPRGLWAALGLVFALWAIGAVTASSIRLPDSSRYLFPGAVAVLIVAAEAAEPVRWSRAGLIALFLFFAAGLGTNLILLREAGTELRSGYAVQVRAAFGALDLVGPYAAGEFEPPSIPAGQAAVVGGQSPLTFPFHLLAEGGREPTRAYFAAADRYGSLGYSQAKLEAQSEAVRAQADAVMAAALGLRLARSQRPASHLRCRSAGPGPDGRLAIRLPRGGALVEAGRRGGAVGVRRLASSARVAVGSLSPGTAAVLRIPPDRSSVSWWLSTTASPLTVCALR